MQQLTLPGIDFAPTKVRRHGLREFHHYPLVSYGKNAAGLWLGSRRVPPELAWTYPELELGRTANSIPALIFDLDGHPPDWLVDVFRPPFPVPNWMTFRRAQSARAPGLRPGPAGAAGRAGAADAAGVAGADRGIPGLQAASGRGLQCGAGPQSDEPGEPGPLPDGLAAPGAVHPGGVGRRVFRRAGDGPGSR